MCERGQAKDFVPNINQTQKSIALKSAGTMKGSWFLSRTLAAWKRPLSDQRNSANGCESQQMNNTKTVEFNNEESNLSSPVTDGSPEEEQVCQMTESPYRIHKMAAMGIVSELERLYGKDPDSVTKVDPKGLTPLHHAAVKDQPESIVFLCNRGADLSLEDFTGKTALHLAVSNGSCDAIISLLEQGADINTSTQDFKTPLHIAVQDNQMDALKILTKYKESLEITKSDDNGLTALHHAALNDNQKAGQILLASYTVCPNQPDNNGYYPIHLATKNASVEFLEMLMIWAEDRGCVRKSLITCPDSDGNVPLHLAVHGGEIKAVEICMQNGADISMQQHDMNTPVHLACSQGSLDIVKLMFEMQEQEKSVVLKLKDARGMTPLHCAAMFDHSDLVRYLIKEGASVNEVDNESRTPLLLAARQMCWKCVEVLLEIGADPTIRDNSYKNILHIIVMNGGSINDIIALKQTTSPLKLVKLLNDQDKLGCSPLHYASKSGQIRSLASLLQLGASVRTKNLRNESPLHFAAKYGRYNTVRQLLETPKGFLILNEYNGDGKTALHIASEEGHTRLVQLLICKGALLQRDFLGRTPLHLAAARGNIETITALLAVHGHMLDQVDKDGNTALHLAVRENQPAVVSQLLSLDCQLLENNADATPIDLAMTYKIHEAAIALVTHERGPIEILPVGSRLFGCVCIELIKTLPKVYEAALDQAIKKSTLKENNKDYNIRYLFSPLQLNGNQVDRIRNLKNDKNWQPPPLYACNAMVNLGRVELLMHPLTQKYLEMKWHAYGMYINIIFLLIYLTFLISVTIFAVGVLGGKQTLVAYSQTEAGNVLIESFDSTNLSTAEYLAAHDDYVIRVSYNMCCYVLGLIIITFSLLGSLKEIFHFYFHKLKYFQNGMYIIEWMLYMSAICMVMPVFMGTEWKNQQFNSAAIAVFTAWFTLLLYCQRFDRIGIYIVMFLEILETLLKVLAVFSVLFVAFGLAFFILLSHGNHLAYSTVAISMLRTFSMMLGEIDFMNTFIYPFFNASPEPNADRTLPFPNTTFTILVVFMILMPILLMNLLIGLAVGDIESVRKNAQLKRVAMQVDLHTGLESKLPTILINKVNKEEVVIYPNSTSQKASLLCKIVQALNFCAPYRNKTNEESASKSDQLSISFKNATPAKWKSVQKKMESRESERCEDLLWDELESHQTRFRAIDNQLIQQTKLLKIIMQKMEINTEAVDTDEGVSLDELDRITRNPRRWTGSAVRKGSATSNRGLLSLQD